MAILEILISQTKVGNFANKVVIKKNIARCQVSMNYLQKDIILHFVNNTFQNVSFSCHSGRENINLVESQRHFLFFFFFKKNQGHSFLTIADKSVLYCNPRIGEDSNSK